MNIIDIVKSAPEGATHYGVSGSGALYYYKEIKSTTYQFHSVRDGRPIGEWEENLGNPCSEALPIPKLKTEWVKVEDSIFDLATDLKAGELYCGANGDESDKRLVKTESHIVFLRHEGRPIYRKVEKVINEKQEFEAKFNKIAKEHFNSGTEESWTDYLYNKGCRLLE